jgi:hypothetical protein
VLKKGVKDKKCMVRKEEKAIGIEKDDERTMYYIPPV